MKEIIEIFKTTEISPKVRAKIIIELGHIINYKLGTNITEPLVYELVLFLDPNNEIISQDRYTRHKN